MEKPNDKEKEMDKTIEQIFKTFNHIARELQVYFLSGFLVLINCLLIDYLYFQLSFMKFLETHKMLLAAIIVAYIIGQFCMSVYYIVFEKSSLEQCVKKLFKLKDGKVASMLPAIYSKDKERYLHFVERYVILINMRATLCAASFINLITNVVFLFKGKHEWQLYLATALFAVSMATFLILTCVTDDEYFERVTGLKESPIIS